MSWGQFKFRVFILLTFLTGPVLAQAGTKPILSYAIVDLSSFGAAFVATNINEQGEVVGWAITQGKERAFLWLPHSRYDLPRGIHDIGALPGGWSKAHDINNVGQVVGESRTGVIDNYGQPIWHGFLWSPTSHEMIDLGALPGSEGGSAAYAINDLGQAVGTSFEVFVVFQNLSFLWLPVADLGFQAGLNAFHGNGAYDIDNKGQIVGYSGSDILDSWRAFLWLPAPANEMTAGYHVIPGLENQVGEASAINAWGNVVGYVGLFGSDAFVWSGGESATILDLGYSYGGAADINDFGTVLVSGSNTYPIYEYFLWNSGELRSILPLTGPDPSWSGIHLISMNNREQIVGYGDRDRKTRAILLTPIHPDLDRDGSVHWDDASLLATCLHGPAEEAGVDCANSDIDLDGDVDLLDWRAWVRGFEANP